MTRTVDRRAFMGGTAVVALSAGTVGLAPARAGEQTGAAEVRGGFATPVQVQKAAQVTLPDLRGDYDYEVTRTEDEWRAMLNDEEYNILRKGSTELPETGDLWKVFDDGTYHCRGCELKIYDSTWKVDVELGWNFFRHSVPDAVLTGIDGPVIEYGQAMGGPDNMIEIHCRRCGSHMGHIVRVGRDPLHCINGQSLTFQPISA